MLHTVLLFVLSMWNESQPTINTFKHRDELVVYLSDTNQR